MLQGFLRSVGLSHGSSGFEAYVEYLQGEARPREDRQTSPTTDEAKKDFRAVGLASFPRRTRNQE